MAAPLSLQPAAGVGMTSDRTRRRMIERLREKGIRDERVLAVMANTPRHLFVDAALASRAYDDVSLPLGHGQTISQPGTVARMTELLFANGRQPRKVLEIGTGCGYQSAILAQLIPEVHSIERIAALLARAKLNLRAAGIGSVKLRHADGRLGIPDLAPFDAIITTAAALHVPDELVHQLAAGGRLVLPLGNGEQHLWTIDKTESGINKTRLEPVRFVPLLSGRG